MWIYCLVTQLWHFVTKIQRCVCQIVALYHSLTHLRSRVLHSNKADYCSVHVPSPASKLREAFASSRVTVTLDRRDQEAPLDSEGDNDAAGTSGLLVVQDVQLHRQVRMLPIFSATGSSSISDILADSR